MGWFIDYKIGIITKMKLLYWRLDIAISGYCLVSCTWYLYRAILVAYL